MDSPNTPQQEDKFVPKGAMAFFVAMIVAYFFLWMTVYFLIITRM